MTKRHSVYADQVDQMKRDRLGLTRRSDAMTFAGIAVGSLVSIVLLRDRWCNHLITRRARHIALERLYFTDQTGHLHTAKRFIVHDVKSGHVEDIGQFFNVRPV